MILNPVSNLLKVGDEANVKFMLTRLVDYLKLKNITAVCTSLVEHENIDGMNAQGISSSLILGSISVSSRVITSAIVESR